MSQLISRSFFHTKLLTRNKKLVCTRRVQKTHPFSHKPFQFQQKRTIALYRVTSRPWKSHDMQLDAKEAKLFHTSIMEYLEKGEVTDALNLFHVMRGRGVMPRLETYRALMIHYYKNGEGTELINAVTDLQSKGIVIDIFTCNLILDVFSKNGQVEFAKKAFQDLYIAAEGQINKYALESLINCYVFRERWPEALALLNAFEEYGWTVDPEINEKVKAATLAKANQKYAENTNFIAFIQKNPDEYYARIVDGAKKEWRDFRKVLNERIGEALHEGNHPSLYRGVNPMVYEDECPTAM